MKKIALLLSLPILFPPAAFAAVCEGERWLNPENEAALVQKHSGFLKREGDVLTVTLKNGKTKTFREGSNGKEPRKVFAVDPNGAWVALFEPKDGAVPFTRLVHRESGRDEKFAGCPDWSRDGKNFVSLGEAGVAGATANEARLWRCDDPTRLCKRIWSSKKGGHGVTWNGGKVEIVLREAGSTGEENLQKVHCAPTEKGAYCQTKLPDLPKKKKRS